MENVKKLTYEEFENAMIRFNSEHGISSQVGKEKLEGIIVFKQESFTEPYTKVQRSYKTNNLQKAFIPSMISSSLFADCLDNTDNGVRLDWYMKGEGAWKVEYCYLLEKEGVQ